MSRLYIAFTALFALAFVGTFQAGDLAAQQQQAQDSITGTITDLNDNQMTLRTDDQGAMAIRVDRDTRILDARGQRVEVQEGDLLGSLQSGDWVVVHYRAGQGDQHIAVSVETRTDYRQQARGADTAQTQQRQEQMRQEQLRQRQDELPRTSSTLPLFAALGLLGLAGAGALSVAARRER